jgi:subtilisin family serine protease
MAAALTRAQIDAPHSLEILIHFDSVDSVKEFCDASHCSRNWTGVVNACLVTIPANDTKFQEKSDAAISAATGLNGTISYNNPIKVVLSGADAIIPELVDTASAAGQLYPNLTCNATGVNAYILDTGIRASHEEFLDEGSEHSRVSTDFNDFNGTEIGTDDCGHGTHVAGILGGRTVGIARNVSLHSVKVLDAHGEGTTVSMLDGLDFVFRNMQKPAVISISIGLSVVSPIIDAAIGSLSAKDVLILVAAGNAAEDACLTSLGSAEGGFAVGAIDELSRQAGFSDFGNCVKLFADGVEINSSWYTTDSAYHVLTGTSMATPLVAGVASCLLGRNRGLARTQLAAALTELSKRTPRGNLLTPEEGDDDP